MPKLFTERKRWLIARTYERWLRVSGRRGSKAKGSLALEMTQRRFPNVPKSTIHYCHRLYNARLYAHSFRNTAAGRRL